MGEASTVKGVAVREFLLWMEQRDGEDAVRERLGRLGAEERHRLDFDARGYGLLAASWYDAPFVHAVLEALIAPYGPEERLQLARDGDRAVMAATFGGIYRGLFRMLGSPRMVAKYVQTVWNKYYGDGEARIEPEGPPEARLEVRGWRGYHPFILEMNAEGMRIIYEGLGHRDVESRVEARGPELSAIRIRFGRD